VQYSHDPEQASTYAEKALKRIKGEGLASTPDIFELWYVYYSGQSPEISRMIDALVSNGQQITEERCRELYSRHLTNARSEEVVHRAGSKVHDTILDVAGLVKDVSQATSDYRGKLDGFSEEVQRLDNSGEFGELLNAVINDTDVVISHNHKLEEQLEQSVRVMEDLREDLQNVKKEALTDGLTGLANRKSFDAEIKRIAEEASVNNKVFSLIMLDIDHFKIFNDNFGHQVGDQVLRLVARTLVSGIKGRDIAARYGGEEFTILLPDTSLSDGVTLADSLRRSVEAKTVVNRNTGENLSRITISAGVAEYFVGEDPADLIERSDAALYTAKHNGRNQVAAAPTPHLHAEGRSGGIEAG
jgi:diguanylate cyclase